MKYKLFYLLVFLSTFTFGQAPYSQSELTINEYISGTLLLPSKKENPDLVILIQGSGPVDRDGNQPFLKNDAFKKLAQELGDEGIASFRFDKRIAAMERLNLTEEEMRFDDFVQDAEAVVSFFTEEVPHGNLIIAGHSQGSLVGMLVAKDKADAFISIAGAGQPIDSIIVDQLKLQMPGLDQSAREAFAILREEGEVTDFNPFLASLFRPQIQSFMLSWMKYDPSKEINRLNMPVLIISGTEDLQVSLQEGELLQQASPGARLVELKNMNHVLREVEGNAMENQKSYNEPALPLHPELVSTITTFMAGVERDQVAKNR